MNIQLKTTIGFRTKLTTEQKQQYCQSYCNCVDPVNYNHRIYNLANLTETAKTTTNNATKTTTTIAANKKFKKNQENSEKIDDISTFPMKNVNTCMGKKR